MGSVAALVRRKEHRILVGAALVTVHLAERLAVCVDAGLDSHPERDSAPRSEERNERPSVEQAAKEALLVLEEVRLPEHGLIEEEPNVIRLWPVHGTDVPRVKDGV